ncbi:MAG: redox-sensing transcriptional repressor Rex [Clostridiales Family XIII bacterium]|jgi:redox-sensing transcriptional repressor|nr:redox-sensing transcriptional repressor Rex [Clostridiales Family XIII bacterium]
MDDQMKSGRALSVQTFKRLPDYFNYLRELQRVKIKYIGAPAIAKSMGLGEVQVRKDLASVSPNPGKPRVGFEVEELIKSIGNYLGYNNTQDAVLVGAGNLGKALLGYPGFEGQGVRIVAAFDKDENLAETMVGSKKIFPMEKLSSMCSRMHIHIGIITVPAPQAQEVCKLMVESGILAILNFAPVHLEVPNDVLVQNENMALQLAILSRHLAEKMGQR